MGLTSNEANEAGTPRLNNQVSRGPDGDTARQGGVLNVDHVELVVRAEQVGEGKGAHATCAQAKDSVDDDPVLRSPRSKGCVRGGGVGEENEKCMWRLRMGSDYG